MAFAIRGAFHSSSGASRLFVADVGQDKFEEIDLVQKGCNYGWNTMEGAHCFSPSSGCDMTGLTLPIAEYDHSEGVTVIGGYVYHGTAIASLAGVYILGISATEKSGSSRKVRAHGRARCC